MIAADDQGMMEDCNEAASCRNHPFSEWEVAFLESVTEQFEVKQWLSTRQSEVLERMWDKI